MPKTVLIILAAVVALIVIVVLTGMRYLRADDEDDFDDDVPAEHGRSRSHGGYPPADQARSRQRHRDEQGHRGEQGHPDDRADDRNRERVGATRAARPGQGRDERGADRRGPDQRGPGRRGDDRSWREDARPAAGLEVQGRNGRAASAARDQRPARGGHLDRDISEPMAVARASRPVPARGASQGDDYDSQPGRRMPDFDHDPRGSLDSRDRRDSRSSRPGIDDDYAARRDSREPGRDRRDGRVSRDRSDVRDSRPAASRMDDSDRDERDRRSSTRPNARPDARKNGPVPDDDLLPAVKPRQSRGKRDGEGDWPSNEWDELSDVDFWAELASDGPFTAQETAEPARTEPARSELSRSELSRSERRGSRADRDARTDKSAKQERGARQDGARQDRDARLDRDARHDSALGQARADRHDSRISEPVTKQVSRPGREELDSGIMPAARHRDLQADRPSATRASEPRPAVADDDPLTSPSFPRISADDSRSYRRSRSASADSRHAGGRMPADPPSYPSMPRVEPLRGIDGASSTRRHSLPAASAAELTDGYRTPATAYPADHAQAAEPYGSLPASLPGYQAPAATSYSAESATASYSVPAHSGSYQVPGEAPYGGSGGYQATSGYQNGSSGSYLPPAGTGSGFAAETSASGYQSLPPAGPEPYRSDLGPASYQGTSSYSLPPGYGAGPGDLAADYPASGYHPASYQGYGGATSASGSHQRPESGYPGGSYSGGAEHSLPSSLPPAQPDLGYPVYPAPVPASRTGYETAPYQGGGYDPAGYQPPAREANGYAGADPYAVDPYGQHGYGGTGY